jgi:hypothetical protein
MIQIDYKAAGLRGVEPGQALSYYWTIRSQDACIEISFLRD